MTSKTNEHGYCPNCHSNLDGGSIWLHFYKESNSMATADKTAALYGATKEYGCWGRATVIYDVAGDRGTEYQCPDCDHRWPR